MVANFGVGTYSVAGVYFQFLARGGAYSVAGPYSVRGAYSVVYGMPGYLLT